MSSNSHPLRGLSLALTRPIERCRTFSTSLQGLGAEVYSLPTIVIRYLCPDLNEHLDNLVTSPKHRSLALVSMEATRAFQQYLNTSYPNTQIPSWNHIFSIGEKTHNVAKELGFRAHEYHLASPSNDVGLGGVIRTTLTMDDTLIAPRGNRARIEWSDSLIREGFDVMRPLVYETQDATPLENGAPKRVDFAVFFSPSAVEAWKRLYNHIEVEACAVIGQTTAKACQEVGMNVSVVAPSPTEAALIESLKDYVSESRR